MREMFASDLKTAMKAGEKRRVETIRMVIAALKERDIEAGPAEKAEKIADATPSQLAVAPAPGDNEAAEEVRRSTSKTRESTEGGDDAGTIAGEPEVQKQ